MTRFALPGEFIVSVDGQGQLRAQFERYYDRFEAEGMPDTTVHLTVKSPQPEIQTVLNGPHRRYGRADSGFVIDFYGERLHIDQEWRRFECAPGFRIHTVGPLIESELRKRLADENEAILHASGVRYRDATFAFPAWQRTGKTNALLTLLEAGADFLADDRTFVRSDGTVRGYPIPITLLSNNVRSFSDALAESFLSLYRAQLTERIGNAVRNRSDFVSRGLDVLNDRYVRQERWSFPEEIFPTTSYVESAMLDHVVLLRTDRSLPSGTVQRERIDPADLVAAVRSITTYEFDDLLSKVSSAYDLLFPDARSKLTEVERLRASDAAVLAEAFERETISIHQLRLPLEATWGHGTKAALVDVIDDIM